MTGTTTYLREQNPALKIGLADVPGASLYSWFTEGVLKGEGGSVAEGIGVNRITGNLNGLSVDHAYRIEDAEFLPILFDLVREEGLSLGPSSGVNIAGAIRMARDLGPGHTIVTVLCDAGQRYASKIYDQAFLNARGLPTPDWIGR